MIYNLSVIFCSWEHQRREITKDIFGYVLKHLFVRHQSIKEKKRVWAVIALYDFIVFLCRRGKNLIFALIPPSGLIFKLCVYIWFNILYYRLMIFINTIYGLSLNTRKIDEKSIQNKIVNIFYSYLVMPQFY